MEEFFKVKVVALCLFVDSLVLISCNEDEESISQESLDSVEHINKNAIYVVIANDTHNPKNTKKFRKVFNAGTKLCITYTPGSSFWSTVLASVKSTYKMPIKKLIGGEALLAGKRGSHWGGMYIKKN